MESRPQQSIRSMLLFLAAITWCNHASLAQQVLTNNEELLIIYEGDQSDRESSTITSQVLLRNDSLRQIRVYQLLDSGLVRTGIDYYNAAMIFQHGLDTISSSMAVKLMKTSIGLDPSIRKWLLAAAIDRDLMYRGMPQIYGTQYVKSKENEEWELYKLDTNIVTDQERIEYGIKPLNELRIEAEGFRNMKFVR